MMTKNEPESIEIVRKKYEKVSERFDRYENAFIGNLYNKLEWKSLVEIYLPKDRNARILDAGGGTGRIILPLAKMGYKPILLDVSSKMLNVAKEKLQKKRILNRVKIVEADIASLPFSDETFDLVICLHGPLSIANSLKACKEFSRIMKKGSKIIVSAHSRYWACMHELTLGHLEIALKLSNYELDYAYDLYGDWCRVFSLEELKELFEKNDIKVFDIYGSFTELLPARISELSKWDDKLFSQVEKLMLRLREEPSVIGMAFNLTLVGEKR
ncbi:MAG: methyltransferase domain-containing protein [Campylobacterota bacterium]|nr:methyltransferase domain-containing protein [Campylobacterota bacterium]